MRATFVDPHLHLMPPKLFFCGRGLLGGQHRPLGVGIDHFGKHWLVESFFKNDEGHNVTVNGDRYRAMITNFFIPELNNHDVQELWFQQDGGTWHTARATIDLLKDTFGGRLISRFGPVNWPPRSCDLTTLDYFLWGYVKSLVYADKPQTLDPFERLHLPCYCQYTATNVGKSHQKLDVQIGLHPSQPWQSYARSHI
ncbi:uncharacterized protein TNCV_2363521 [Trichonephila clavipes]|nr:uncharacterized protein TNCV_2363521 [Trichonephila clavipes]